MDHQHEKQSQQQQVATDHPSSAASSITSSNAEVDRRCGGRDAYDRFEIWLRENGGTFEQLELREYDSETYDSAFAGSKSDNDGAQVQQNHDEEKKDSGAVSDNKTTREIASMHHTSGGTTEPGEMRGVHAKSSIPPNTVCMVVPRRCLITVEMGQATDIGRQIMAADVDLDAPKHIYLMVYILQDRLDPNSFFRPYYDILPKTLSNMPIFWTRGELSWLEGSYLLQQIRDRTEAIEEDYKAICQVCPQLAEIATLEEFKWARMCVCSRNFGLQIEGTRTSALVPHADMLNHYRPRETKWTFDDERQAFTITTLKTIHAGSQIYDSYGQKCNHRFLLNYGFAVENNIEFDGFCPNEVPLELSISRTDALFERKIEFWCREESPVVKRVRVCISNNENTKVLMSMLRVIVADAAECEAICAAGVSGSAALGSSAGVMVGGSSPAATAFRCVGGSAAGATCLGMLVYRTCRDIRFPLSLRNERAALTHLLSIVRVALARYPTSLAEDNERLAGNELPQFSNARHAVIQVRGEKEVLHHFKDLALTALHVLDLADDDQFYAAVRSLQGMGKHHLIVRYCADVLGAARREEKRRIGRSMVAYGGASTGGVGVASEAADVAMTHGGGKDGVSGNNNGNTSNLDGGRNQ